MSRRALTRPLRRAGPLIALAIAGVTVISAIGVVLLVDLREAGLDHELEEAEDEAQLAANVIVGPRVTPELLRGDHRALAELDRAVRQRMQTGRLRRVKVWTPDGRIAYSDEPRLIGRRFPLERDEKRLLARGGVTSELSRLDKPENRFERGHDRLVEVYTRVKASAGIPVLYESYRDFESIAASSRALWSAILPPLLVGLALLELANLAVAAWLIRYQRRRDQQRAALLQNALDASDRERKRIVGELHDGVVQDLTGA
jgi:signal transduction histidine kinase